MSDRVESLYEPGMRAARDRAANHPALQRLLSPTIPARLLERFLIEYCAQGVQVTEPVERWIRGAGERCKQLGYTQTGDALIKHAAHEAGHEQLFIADTRYLVQRWNARFPEYLDDAQLLAQPATPGMRAYIALHEQIIESDAPYAQVAVEYEIERLSVDLLPSLMGSFERKLGREVLGGLSFLTEHAAIDVGHTQLNRKMMGRLLTQEPAALPALQQAGERALDAYLQFFGECLAQAEACLGHAHSLAG